MPRPKSPDPKTDALRSVGALNPHPAAVKDQIFAGSDFFDRRDLVQVRYEMVRRVRTDGRPIAETATRFGVSRPTYYKLSAEFEREGICGLLPKKRGPKGGHKLRAEIIEALRTARTQDPAVDAASLVELVKRRFGVVIHARTIERALKKNFRERARSRCWPRAFPDRALRGTAKHSVRGDGCRQRPWAGLADALWCGGLDASMGELCCPTSNST